LHHTSSLFRLDQLFSQAQATGTPINAGFFSLYDSGPRRLLYFPTYLIFNDPINLMQPLFRLLIHIPDLVPFLD